MLPAPVCQPGTLRISTECPGVFGVHFHPIPPLPPKWLAGVKTGKYTVFTLACLQVTHHFHPTHQCTAFNTISKHYFLRLEITGFPWALIYHLTSFLFNLSLQSLFHSMKWYPCTPYFSFWGKPTKIIFCLDGMASACNFVKQVSENNILLIENSQWRLQLRNFDRRNGILDTFYPKFHLLRKERAWKLSERTIFPKPCFWKEAKSVPGFKQRSGHRNTPVLNMIPAKSGI